MENREAPDIAEIVHKQEKMRHVAESSCSVPILVCVSETFETTDTGDTRAWEAVLAAAADQPAAPQACSGQ